MPDPVECLKIYKGMVEMLLVLQVLLADYSKVKDSFSGVPSYSKTCLFLFDDFLRLWLQSVEEDS